MLFCFTFLFGYPWLLIFPGFRRPWFPCSNCCGLQSALCDHVTCAGISSVSICLSQWIFILVLARSDMQSLIRVALWYVVFKWKSYKIQTMFLTQFLVLLFVWQSMGLYIVILMSSISWYFFLLLSQFLCIYKFKSLTIHRTKIDVDEIPWNTVLFVVVNTWTGCIIFNNC